MYRFIAIMSHGGEKGDLTKVSRDNFQFWAIFFAVLTIIRNQTSNL